jgi:hypothetical protein
MGMKFLVAIGASSTDLKIWNIIAVERSDLHRNWIKARY